MGDNQTRLHELREELDRTYKEMREILVRNNISRKMVANLPSEEYKRWSVLNKKSTTLINEFVVLLGTIINR